MLSCKYKTIKLLYTNKSLIIGFPHFDVTVVPQNKW